MKISIMQPYLFPYIGYFQMIKGSDCFVIADAVQYIQGGWINRNRILLNGEAHYIMLPVVKDDYRLNINKRYFVDDPAMKFEKKLLNTLYHAYHKAPNFKDCYEVIEEIILFENKNVAKFTANSLKRVCEYLEIKTEMGWESDINIPKELNYQEKVIYMCKEKKANCYINAIGGTKLYSTREFSENNLELRFIKTKESLEYRQFKDRFIPNLSIIDAMMFNSPKEMNRLLSEYDLIEVAN